MSKKARSIVVSYRLSPMIIAKAIDGLKTFDKSAGLDALSSICKQTMLHGVNYLTRSLPFEPSQESQKLVSLLSTQGKKIRLSIEEEILGQAFSLPQAIHEERESTSEKSIVTDWSVTDDMREEEE